MGLTGSVACYKILDLCRELLSNDIWISASLTEAGSRFVTTDSLRALGVSPILSSLFEDPDHSFPHLEPAQQADVLLVAPATANFLAKMAWGLADDILSTQVLAFSGPTVAAPAMNPNMWQSAATQSNVATLRERGVTVLEPEAGDVACGEVGKGRLPEVKEIEYNVLRALAPRDMEGMRILVTLGPTREHLDPVRYWSNPSTGKMGAAMATAAWLRGAEVHCVCGPCAVDLPHGIPTTSVQTAQQMYEACTDLWPHQDMACLCAAVCDFRPAYSYTDKIKKDRVPEGEMNFSFAPNPDILYTLGRNKKPFQRLIGFAAETGKNLESEARIKLDRKNLDWIVANRVDRESGGFASEENSVLVLGGAGHADHLGNETKSEIAWRLWDLILRS